LLFVFCYIKNKNCDDLFERWFQELIKARGGKIEFSEGRFSITSHGHFSAATIYIDHYAAHLPPLLKLRSLDGSATVGVIVSQFHRFADPLHRLGSKKKCSVV
jgi:hypothetical protein